MATAPQPDPDLQSGLQFLRAEPSQRLADWSRDHFRLSEDSSHQTGQWQPWAYQVGLLDFMSDDDIVERLRLGGPNAWEMVFDAADLIVRQREALREAREACI